MIPSLSVLNHKPLTDKCVILDLDECLVHSFEDMDAYHKLGIAVNPEYLDLRARIHLITMEDAVDVRGTGDKSTMWCITRPYLKEFLVFVHTYFKVKIVWSAGVKRYVHAVVESIFNMTAPHFVYTRDDTIKDSNGIRRKPIQKLLDESPVLSKHVTMYNTYVIDDNEDTFGQNVHNAIRIPVFNPNPTIEGLRQDDHALYNIMNWLSLPEVMYSKDVRGLDKRRIFSS